MPKDLFCSFGYRDYKSAYWVVHPSNGVNFVHVPASMYVRTVQHATKIGVNVIGFGNAGTDTGERAQNQEMIRSSSLPLIIEIQIFLTHFENPVTGEPYIEERPLRRAYRIQRLKH